MGKETSKTIDLLVAQGTRLPFACLAAVEASLRLARRGSEIWKSNSGVTLQPYRMAFVLVYKGTPSTEGAPLIVTALKFARLSVTRSWDIIVTTS